MEFVNTQMVLATKESGSSTRNKEMVLCIIKMDLLLKEPSLRMRGMDKVN